MVEKIAVGQQVQLDYIRNDKGLIATSIVSRFDGSLAGSASSVEESGSKETLINISKNWKLEAKLEDSRYFYNIDEVQKIKFYQVTFRKKLYATLEELQKDLDEWMKYYNNERTHQGKVCCGRTPLETLLDGKKVWAEKNLAQI